MKQQLGSICEKMTALNDLTAKEQRDLTMEEQQRWERMESEMKRLDGQITRTEMQEKREAEMAKTAFHNGESPSRLAVAAMEA